MDIKNNDSYFNYFVCAGLAGALASIPTNPFDVIKTRLNTQTCLSNNYEKKRTLCNTLNSKSKVDYALNWKSKSEPEFRLKMGISSEKLVKLKYANIHDAAYKIFQEEGVMGFFSGLKMRIPIQSLSSAIAWGTYHVINKFFSGRVNNLH